ncbi:TIGR04255 family protein [Morganella morganii]
MSTPTHLDKQPVINAVFDLIYTEQAQISETIPGFLFLKFERKYKIESLPASQIPKSVRENDEQLHLAPVSRIQLENYILNFSDRGISISIGDKYSGWSDFKKEIINIINNLKELDIDRYLNRVSLSYIDFFNKEDYKQENILNLLDINIILSQIDQATNKIDLQVEKEENDITTNIRILNRALVSTSGGSDFNAKGLILDIACSKTVDDRVDIPSVLDNIHEYNKSTFFNCLKQETIELLSPHYE